MSSSYSGTGQVRLMSGTIIPCTFEISQKETTDIRLNMACRGSYIEIMTQIRLTDNSALNTISLSGTASNGFELAPVEVPVGGLDGNSERDEAKISGPASSIHLSSPSKQATHLFRCLLVNAIFNCIDFSPRNSGYTRDKFTARLSGRDCVFRMLNDSHTFSKILSDSRFQITSTVDIPFEAGDTVTSILELLFDIEALLSFAQGSLVSCASVEEIQVDGSVAAVHLLNPKTRPFTSGFPVIENISPAEPYLKVFLESALGGFQANKVNLQLQVFLAFYLESKLHQTKSIKFLLASIAAESIKSNFRTWQGLPQGSFINLLTATFDHFGLRGETFSFKTFRDKVVHTGDDQLAWPDFWREYSKLLNQLERLFMKVCGYNGKFLDLTDHFNAKQI